MRIDPDLFTEYNTQTAGNYNNPADQQKVNMFFKRMTRARIISLLFFGLILIVLPISMLISANDREKNCTAETTGKVIDYEVDTETNFDTGSTCTYYSPVISYTAEDGIRYKTTCRLRSNEKSFQVGQSVRVLYDPQEPTKMILPDYEKVNNARLFYYIPILVGIVILIDGIRQLTAQKKQNRPPDIGFGMNDM